MVAKIRRAANKSLKYKSFIAWRLMNDKDRAHRAHIKRVYNTRPRLRQETRH